MQSLFAGALLSIYGTVIGARKPLFICLILLLGLQLASSLQNRISKSPIIGAEADEENNTLAVLLPASL